MAEYLKPIGGDTTGVRTLRRPRFLLTALVGAAGSLLLAGATDLPGSRYGPHAAGLWPLAGTGPVPGWEGPKVPPWAEVADQAYGVATGHVLATVAVVVGLALLAIGWLHLWRVARGDSTISPRGLWWIGGAWVAPLLLATPFGTQDVWTYGAEGNLVLKGVGGYRTAALLKDSVWSLGVNGHAVHPSPYGPAALDVSAFFVWISGGHPWVAAEGWRFAAIVGVVLCAWGVHRIVSIKGGNATAATLVAVANPATLVIFVAGMHNDALMLGLMVAGIALALSGRRFMGVVLCTLAMAVKPNALLAVGALSWWVWGTSWRDRAKGTVIAAATSVGVLFISGIGVGGGFGWISTAQSYGSTIGPWTLGVRFLGVQSQSSITAIEVAGLALAVAVVLIMGRSGRWIVGLGWGFLILALSIPKPEPWYLAWSVALLACGGLERRSEKGVVAVLVMMMTGSVLPLATVWWFGGTILLAWLAVMSTRERPNRIGPLRTGCHEGNDRENETGADPTLALTGQRAGSST